VHDDSYGKIINKKHFDRLSALCPEAVRDEKTLKIAPTVVEDATPDHPLMQEEIFGPILPVLTVDKIGDAKEIVARHPTPLALYVFTSKGKVKRDFLQTVAFGGGCVNDTIIHLATSEAGFGGVGTSGTGAYHGRVGFETFTHVKTVVDKKTLLDLPMRYRPVDKFKTALIRMFVR
jgi:aldehyde dehydrogenase (NAD+)